MSDTVLSVVPCPRCECHMVRTFDCTCGAVHDEFCANCGRWTSLPTTHALVLGPIDEVCKEGRTDHQHFFEKKEQRIVEFFSMTRKTE